MRPLYISIGMVTSYIKQFQEKKIGLMHVTWLGLVAGTLRAPPTKPSRSLHHLVSDRPLFWAQNVQKR